MHETPLRWWRKRQPNALRSFEIAAITKTIANVALIGEPHWPGARIGDAASAVRLALDHDLRQHGGHRTDLIMSALLVCAARGDGAARLVLQRQRIVCAGKTAAGRTRP
jgi:hypothetical protein